MGNPEMGAGPGRTAEPTTTAEGSQTDYRTCSIASVERFADQWARTVQQVVSRRSVR